MTQEPIRVLLADDHAILRQGLRRILDDEGDMEVVGEAATGSEAVKLASEMEPDVVVLDISMPDQNGIESTRQISAACSSRVLVLSVHDERQIIANAVTAGAAGYLLKDSLDNELINAIRTVRQGRAVFSAAVTRTLASPEAAPANENRSITSSRRAKRKFSSCSSTASHRPGLPKSCS